MVEKPLVISFITDLILDKDLHKTREVEVVKAVAKRGNAVSLVAVTSEKSFQINDRKINLVSVPIRQKRIISHLIYTGFVLIFLPYHILAKKPDLVVISPDISVIGSIPSLLIARCFKIKIILDVKSTPVEVNGFNAKLSAFWFNISVIISKLFFEGFDVVTPMMRNEICKQYSIDKKKVQVWTNGVPIDKFNSQLYNEDSRKLKEQLNLADKFIVFYHGVFSASRGLTETISAVEEIRKKHPNIVFFILGSGVIADSLKEYIHRKALEDNIIIHDPVPYDEVPKFIGISDVCIVPLQNNPYWRHQSPLKLLEYLAMEKVVIASDIIAHRTVVNKENCCIYLSAVEPIAIANAIEYAYTNRKSFGEWGKKGREIITDQFTWDKVARDILDFI